jgi:hypothetical protein
VHPSQADIFKTLSPGFWFHPGVDSSPPAASNDFDETNDNVQDHLELDFTKVESTVVSPDVLSDEAVNQLGSDDFTIVMRARGITWRLSCRSEALKASQFSPPALRPLKS